MIEDTETYYRRRRNEEFAAAERATDPVAAQVHRSLAARYSILSGVPPVLATEPSGPDEDEIIAFRQAR